MVFSAMSSIEHTLMVESENGMPNFSAARAALISPSAVCMPPVAAGAMATGMAISWPSILTLRFRPSRFTATFWLSLILLKSLSFSR
ncbi:hypothetical protein D3C87_1930880 [compost metagenome]